MIEYCGECDKISVVGGTKNVFLGKKCNTGVILRQRSEVDITQDEVQTFV